MDPRCKILLVVAGMDYGTNKERVRSALESKHGAHSVVLVPCSSAGVTFERALTAFGYNDVHGNAQSRLDAIPSTSEDQILGEGSGFRVSQARLGPGRIHHCLRAVGMGELGTHREN